MTQSFALLLLLFTYVSARMERIIILRIIIAVDRIKPLLIIPIKES